MKLLIKLAWRNIWRNKRRSIFTLAAVTFAVYIAIAQRGIQLGTYNLNIQNAVELFSGYLQIQNPDYHENHALNRNFEVGKNLENTIKSVSGISGYSERVYAEGLITFKNHSYGTGIMGLDPEKEKDVTVLTKNINAGEFFKSESSYEVVLEDQFLKNIKGSIGDRILIMTQGLDGVVRNREFKISGSIRTGIPDLEKIALMPLKTSQEILAMGDRVNVIALKINQLYHTEKIREKLSEKISHNNLRVLTWDDLNPELNQAIAMDNVSGILLLIILFIIVAFGILNTVLMSITERFREFGIELAVGMPYKNLIFLIFLETMFLSLIGLVIGDVAGYATNYYLILHPIKLGAEVQQLTELYHFVPEMRSTLQPSIFQNISIAVIIISFVSCFYPAWKVYKLEPLKGIRHT